MTLAPRIAAVIHISLAAALPLFFVALVFNYPLAFPGRYFPGTDLELLGYMMQAEFLAVASGIVVISPLLVRTHGVMWRWIRRAVFAVSGFTFCWVANEYEGIPGMLSYVLLVFVSFGGGSLFVFDRLTGVTRGFLSLLRWSTAIFLYLSFQLQFELDVDIASWRDMEQVVSFGAAFFYTLTLMETLVYPWLVYHLEGRLKTDEQMTVAMDLLKMK